MCNQPFLTSFLDSNIIWLVIMRYCKLLGSSVICETKNIYEHWAYRYYLIYKSYHRPFLSVHDIGHFDSKCIQSRIHSSLSRVVWNSIDKYSYRILGDDHLFDLLKTNKHFRMHRYSNLREKYKVEMMQR